MHKTANDQKNKHELKHHQNAAPKVTRSLGTSYPVLICLFQTNGRMKAMRRQLDEAEEEISREKAHRRKVRNPQLEK